MFAAIKANEGLLNNGHILPVLRGSPKLLEDYGGAWGEKYYAANSGDKPYYQSRTITRADLDKIATRIDFFRSAQYSVMIARPVDRTVFQSAFLACISEILDAEPDLDITLKEAVLQTATSASSPLGKIRQEVLRPVWNQKGLAAAAHRVARRINLAFFGCGAAELDTWFSLQRNAFQDLKNA